MTSTTANLAIIDTSVYIDNLRSRRFEKELLEIKLVVRCSAVVLAELWRGARYKLIDRGVEDCSPKEAQNHLRGEGGWEPAAWEDEADVRPSQFPKAH